MEGEALTDIENENRAIALIPACDLLFYRPPEYWIKRFHETSGEWPTDIVLPAITNDGAAFESAHADQHQLTIGTEGKLDSWVREIRDRGDEMRIWLLVNVNFSSIGNELLVVVDQWDVSLPGHACIGNPLVQKIAAAIVDELMPFQTDGVVFDLADAYPNSASALYPKRGEEDSSRLQNTCFCTTCVAELDKYGWKDGNASFQAGKQTLARYLLQSTPTGVSHIDVNQRLIDDGDEALMLQHAHQRAFVEEGDAEETERQLADAGKVLRYLAARGKVTSQAVRRLSEIVRAADMRSAVILGDTKFDLSQNTSIDLLYRAEAADEYWVPLEQAGTIPGMSPLVVQFLSNRASYYINSLFEDIWRRVESNNEDIGDLDSRLRRTASRMGMYRSKLGLSKGAAKVAMMSEDTQGFVGMPFDRDDLVQTVRQLGRENRTSMRQVDMIVKAIADASPPGEDDAPDPAGGLYE